MARLLKPDDYGLFELSVAVFGALEILTNFSFPRTLIQRKFHTEEETRRYLNTVWTLELLRNALLTLLMLAAAYPATLYFRDPRGIIEFLYGKRWDAAVPVLAVMVYAGLFRGLARTPGPLMLAMHRPGVESKSKFAEGVVFITAALYLVPRGGASTLGKSDPVVLSWSDPR
jgi:PST family polysaccharide transporter